MAIRVNYGPSPTTLGKVAFSTGARQALERDRLRRLQEQQAERDRALRLAMQATDIGARERMQERGIGAQMESQLLGIDAGRESQLRDIAARRDLTEMGIGADMERQRTQLRGQDYLQERRLQEAAMGQMRGIYADQAAREQAFGQNLAGAQFEAQLQQQVNDRDIMMRLAAEEGQYTTQQRRRMQDLQNRMDLVNAAETRGELSPSQAEFARRELQAELMGITPMPPEQPPDPAEQIRMDIPGMEGTPVVVDPETGMPQIMRGWKPPQEPKPEKDPYQFQLSPMDMNRIYNDVVSSLTTRDDENNPIPPSQQAVQEEYNRRVDFLQAQMRRMRPYEGTPEQNAMAQFGLGFGLDMLTGGGGQQAPQQPTDPWGQYLASLPEEQRISQAMQAQQLTQMFEQAQAQGDTQAMAEIKAQLLQLMSGQQNEAA